MRASVLIFEIVLVQLLDVERVTDARRGSLGVEWGSLGVEWFFESRTVKIRNFVDEIEINRLLLQLLMMTRLHLRLVLLLHLLLAVLLVPLPGFGDRIHSGIFQFHRLETWPLFRRCLAIQSVPALTGRDSVHQSGWMRGILGKDVDQILEVLLDGTGSRKCSHDWCRVEWFSLPCARCNVCKNK